MSAASEPEISLKRLEWAFDAYKRATSALLHSGTLGDVAAHVCEAVVKDDAYATAFVGLADPSPGQPVRIIARAGLGAGYVDELDLSWSAETWKGRGPTGRAIRSGVPEFVVDAFASEAFTPWRAAAERYGIRSSVSVPFSRGGDIFGVLVVYGRQPNAFGQQETDVFHQLADELAFALALEREREDYMALKAAAADSAAALAQLPKGENFYQLLADHVRDVIVAYDLEGRLEYVSPSIRQFGYAPSEVVGRPVSDFNGTGDVRTTALRALEEGVTLPSGRSNMIQLRRRDGSLVWLEASPNKIYDPEGRVTGIVTVLRDAEERLAAEAALRRKSQEAEAAAAAKAQFLANMSHEIRTPLTSILGFAELMAGVPGLPDPARRYAERILQGGRSLLGLVNDILDFSRLDVGALEADRRPVNVLTLVDEVVEFMRPRAQDKGLALERLFVATAPGLVVTDGQRLRQILVNLLSNAIKFTPKGRIEVAVEAAGDQKLKLTVTDTGIGVPADQLDRIFQRFSQVDESSTRQFGGAGLGLAIAKSLVEMLGGEIGVHSREGEGASFWFTLAAPKAVEAPAPLVVGDLGPLRVLVVDDVEQNRELLRAILAAFNAQVSEACDGQEAVEAADRQCFDLILMDIQMPRLDGKAAARAIRAHSPLNRATPILAVTADVFPDAVEACAEAGINDHIAKPISVQNLLTKIEHWTAA